MDGTYKQYGLRTKSGLIAFFLSFSIIGASLLIVTKDVYAQAEVVSVPNSCVGGTCPPNFLTDLQNTLTTLDSFFLQKILKPLAWHAAKILLQRLAANVIDWVNTGFDGNPAFLSNPDDFFADIADRAAGEFILNDKRLSFLCSPLRLQVRIALGLQFKRFGDQKCTLSKVVGNIDNFVQRNFLDGGWEGWFELTQRPTNNVFGAFLNAQFAMSGVTEGSQRRNMNLLNFGGGFMSWVECPPGWKRIAGKQDCVYDGPEDPDPNEPVKGATTRAGTVNSPGKIIESQLSGVLGSGKDALIAADDWNEILGFLLSALLNQLFEMGGRGLRGLTSSGFTANNRDEDTRRLIDNFINTEGGSPYANPDPNTIPWTIGGTPQPPTTANFTYSLSAPSRVEVRPGDTISFSVVKEAQTGTQQQTTLSAISSAPASVLVAVVNSACTPGCTATVHVSAAADAREQSYSITFEGSPTATNAPQTTVVVTSTPSSDTVPPTVAITAPANGSSHPNGATITTTATASDDSAVDRVEFSVNSVLAATDAAAPYEFARSYTGPASYTITATAFDMIGNRASDQISISVATTDTTPPVVAFTSVRDGDTLPSMPLAFTVSATDNTAVERVEFYMDGSLTETIVFWPYITIHHFTVRGPHTIRATAFDTAGNSASAIVTINII